MNEFKNSILTLMKVALDFQKISHIEYIPDSSLLIPYDELTLNSDYFQTESIFYVDDSRESTVVNDSCNSVIEAYTLLQNKPLVKINSVENYNNSYIKFSESLKKIFKAHHIDCHIYYGEKEAPSFDFHKDSMHVLIGCLKGKKIIKFKKGKILLNVNEWIYIPANTNHKAEYPEKSVTLSVGIYK